MAHFLHVGDGLVSLAAGNAEILIDRAAPGRRRHQFLHATIGYVSQPREARKNVFVRAELPNCTSGPKALFISGEALRSYFYLIGATGQSLYELLQVSTSATAAELHLAWRLRSIEVNTAANPRDRSRVERAYNLLAHPELRACYDALRTGENAHPLFPYGGFGSILVEGNLSDNGECFFADRILVYKPEMSSRKVSLLLRQCQFLTDRVVCRDPRRKLEVLLDSTLLPGIDWDLTWNDWKHWLRTRIEVDATFVRTGKYRLRNGEWILRTWHTALPSRIRVMLPEGFAADLERARAIHALLGEHADAVDKIRTEVENQPIHYARVQDWLDRMGASSHLTPQHVTWRPDYEPYYFEQLRRRSAAWFLFRNEYLFEWPNVLIAEIPQAGHATYVFAKPPEMDAFLRRYSQASREEVRRNRNNTATDLGFIGRVVRGRKKKRWLDDVLKLAGEKADYVEALE